MTRANLKALRRDEIRFRNAIGPYRRAIGRLSEPEMYAAAVLSTGVNTDGLLKMWTDSRAELLQHGSEASAHAIRNVDYLTAHKAEIDAIVGNAAEHPAVLRATQQAHKVSQLREKWILEAEKQKPGGDVGALAKKLGERKTRQAEVVAGSRLVPEKTLGYEQARPNYADARAEYNAAQAAREALGPLPEEAATEPMALPTPVGGEGEPTFLMKIPSNFYHEARAKGGDLGSVTAERRAVGVAPAWSPCA